MHHLSSRREMLRSAIRSSSSSSRRSPIVFLPPRSRCLSSQAAAALTTTRAETDDFPAHLPSCSSHPHSHHAPFTILHPAASTTSLTPDAPVSTASPASCTVPSPVSPPSSSPSPTAAPVHPHPHPQAVSAAPSPVLPGWHQRPLPAGLVPFSSNRGRRLFSSALSQHLLEGYFTLAEQFTTQSEPAYCGPSTLAMVLNALRIDPRRVWKGNWRWFSEEMLTTCDVRRQGRSALDGVDVAGLGFEEMLLLAECNGAHVQAFRAEQSTLEKFRTAVQTAASRTDIHLVASFSRAVMGQTGCGHYSPIAGYHPQTDSALVMDVARFKYPPYWAPVPLLWKAIQETDPSTGQGRGYYLMSRGEEAGEADCYVPLSSTCRIAVDKQAWARLAEHFCSVLPAQLAAAQPSTPYAVFVSLLSSLPVDVSTIFTVYTHDLSKRYAGIEKEKTARQQQQSAETTREAGGGGLFASYSSFVPAESPHHHPHRVPHHHALQPLLTEISSTPLFQLLASHTAAASSLPLSSASPSAASLSPSLSLSLTHPQSSPSASLHLISALPSLPSSTSASASSSEQLAHPPSHFELQLATLLLFACPVSVFSQLPAALRSAVTALRQYEGGGRLREEIAQLRWQMGILAEVCGCVLEAEREAERRLQVAEALGLQERMTNETVVSPPSTGRREEEQTAKQEERQEWAIAEPTPAVASARRHRFVSSGRRRVRAAAAGAQQ